MIIDSDAHVFEEEETFVTYLEGPYRSRQPVLVRDTKGETRVLMEGRLYAQPEGKGKGVWRGFNTTIGQGAFDYSLRIEHMAQEGIDLQILYPTLGLAVCGLEDAGFALAFCRAYNDWLAAVCRRYPDRLEGVAIVPLQDIKASVGELNRAVIKLGMIGVSIPPNVFGKNLDHPDFFPFYQEAQRLDVPVGIHGSPGVYIPAAGTERFDNFFFTHSVAHPFEQMIAVMCIVCGGVLEKFPRLRFAFLEAGAGWVPYWMERLDEHYEKRPFEVPLMKAKPSEYLKGQQCFFSCDPDEETLPFVTQLIGEDRIIYASDYPHWDCIFPRTASAIRDRTGLSPKAKQKILGENAARLYNIHL